MGRGKDKVVKGSDIPNMSRNELNNVLMRANRISGTACVRKAGSGEVVYSKHARKGRFNEDSLS